jgi:hypothetical protein
MTEDALESDQEGGVLKGLVAAVTDPKVWGMALALTYVHQSREGSLI